MIKEFNTKVEIYFQAAVKVFGGEDSAIQWIDDNSTKITGNANSIKEARMEIYSSMAKN